MCRHPGPPASKKSSGISFPRNGGACISPCKRTELHSLVSAVIRIPAYMRKVCERDASNSLPHRGTVKLVNTLLSYEASESSGQAESTTSRSVHADASYLRIAERRRAEIRCSDKPRQGRATCTSTCT